ncbi:MAG: hypothetical protein HYV27_24100 [Candidatus Hydrogenedentes bacterium]|nr:hypothetical protein [Candidatus Hydrogenedentota bacterium]
MLQGLGADALNDPSFSTVPPGDTAAYIANIVSLGLAPDLPLTLFAVGYIVENESHIVFGYPSSEAFTDSDLDVEQIVTLLGGLVGITPTGPMTMLRLREGIERFLITDINNPAGSAEAQSTIPVMNDRVATAIENFNHIPGGSNVLYMDGHVSFVKFPGEYPICRMFAHLDA